MPEEKEEDEEDLLKLTQMKMIQREYWIKTVPGSSLAVQW